MAITHEKQQANLDLLVNDFAADPESALALRALSQITDSRSWQGFPHLLHSLLHGPHPQSPDIGDESENLIYQVKRIFDFYSLLEVGAVCGALPAKYMAIHPEIAAILLDPVIRRFSQKRYPQPLLAGAMLRALHVHDREDDDVPISKFFTLIELSEFLSQGMGVDGLVWLATGGSICGWDFGDLVEALRGPEQCLQEMLDDAPSGELLRGLFRLLSFCEMFGQCLDDLQDNPLARSAFWHSFRRRIFDPRLKVFDRLRKCIEAISQWKRERADENVVLTARQDPEQLAVVIERLFSGEYSAPYRARIAQMARPLESAAAATKPAIAASVQSNWSIAH
ncbi:MAG: hypothetical protein WCE51_08225 [Chthoniobacterales bacterium]